MLATWGSTAIGTVVVDVDEAKEHFSKLLGRVEAGDEVVVPLFGEPIAKLMPFAAAVPRTPGLLAGEIEVEPGFEELPVGFEIFSE